MTNFALLQTNIAFCDPEANFKRVRAFNIESLAVGVTDDPTISRITIIVDSGNSVVEQVEKQLNKLIEVIKVRTLEENSLIGRGGGRGPIGSVLKGEDILHSAPKDMGDVHGQLQGGVVVSIFQVADGLPPHAHPLGQLLLAEPGLACASGAVRNSQSYLRIHDAGGHRDVYGGAGA